MYGELIPVGAGDPVPLHKTEILVGRHPKCDVVLNYPNVSSQHCRLVLAEGYWYVLDLQSSNGVKVNGRKVTNCRIDPNTQVEFATHCYHLDYTAAGIMPPNTLQEGNIMEHSLLERAGLQRKRPAATAPAMAVPDIAALDMAAVIGVKTVAKAKDFFAELVFD